MDNIEDGWEDEGWDDDGLDNLDDEDNDDVLAALNEEVVPPTQSQPQQLQEEQQQKEAAEEGDFDEGWDWEEDLNLDESAADMTVPSSHEPINQQEHQQQHISDANPFLEIVTQKLLSYIQDMHDPHLLHALNQELSQKNNPECALQLCRYYHSRENLREYTLDTEVPRMEYQIMLSDEIILTQTEEIQNYFIANPVDNLVDDMLLRSSNQSLLADVFPIITGSNKIVRMQFQANAIATKCRLVVDMRHGHKRSSIDCTLLISIPSGLGNDKLTLGELRFLIQFSPEPEAPYVNYQLVSLVPKIDVRHDFEDIKLAARGIDQDHFEAHEYDVMPTDGDNLRDNFLQSVMATQTATGFKSALKEIDGVVNVSKKFNMLKQHLVLPTSDDILKAQEPPTPRNDEDDDNVKRQEGDRIGESMNTSNGNRIETRSKPPPPPPKRTNEANKPKPLIGGMLLSGISKLAKAAAIPEDDERPMLYKREEKFTKDAPVLYKRDDPSPTIPTKQPQPTIEKLQTSMEIGDDMDSNGWSDDGLDDLEDEVEVSDSKVSSSEKMKDTPVVNNVSISTSPEKKPIHVPRQGSISGSTDIVKSPQEQMEEVENNENTSTLPPELQAEKDYLLHKLKEIAEVKNGYVFVENEAGSRKRFVSRAEILNI